MEEVANLSLKIDSCLESGQLTGMGKIYDKVSWNSFFTKCVPAKEKQEKNRPPETDPLQMAPTP